MKVSLTVLNILGQSRKERKLIFKAVLKLPVGYLATGKLPVKGEKYMNEKEIDKINDKINRKVTQLDDICKSIYLPLSLRKSLRYNELFRTVNKLNPTQKSGKDFISKPTFDGHLKHLIKSKLVMAKRKGKQNVTYSISKSELRVWKYVENVDFVEDIEEWIKRLHLLDDFNRIDKEEHYAKLTDNDLEKEVNRDLNSVLKANLSELKTYIKYELKIDVQESDNEFWTFFGNPLYRMLEKVIAENCRVSIRYRTMFFEKLDTMLKKKKLFDDNLGD